MEEQNFYPISELPLFEQLVSKLEDIVKDSYPLFLKVSKNPSIIPDAEIERSISKFHQNQYIVDMSRNQYNKWRADGITEEQEKQLLSLESRENAALKKNTEILGFLNT